MKYLQIAQSQILPADAFMLYGKKIDFTKDGAN